VWLHSISKHKGLASKLVHPWIGPYRIVRQVSPVNYELTTVGNRHFKEVVHVSRLKPFIGKESRPSPSFISSLLEDDAKENTDCADTIISPSLYVDESDAENSIPSSTQFEVQNDGDNSSLDKSELLSFPQSEKSDEVESTEEYEVERIIRSRRSKLESGKTEYLVRWKNYGYRYDSWESESNLINCPDVLDAFKERQQSGNTHSLILTSLPLTSAPDLFPGQVCIHTL
jgi:hypothetical protein